MYDIGQRTLWAYTMTMLQTSRFGNQSVSSTSTQKDIVDVLVINTDIGVNATGDAGDTSPAVFGQPGTKYLISPAKFVKFLLSHAKRHCVEPMNTARCFD